MPTSQIILFSQPRSGCHFLERAVFSQQPKVKQCWHPLGAIGTASQAIFSWLQTGTPETLTEESAREVVAEVEKGSAAWKEALSTRGDDHVLYTHEHACFMFTPKRVLEVIRLDGNADIKTLETEDILVQEQLLCHPGIVPVFTIRHPVMGVPSNFRAVDILYPDSSRANYFMASYVGWNRHLYDWYVKRGVTPIVVDADDYMSSEAFIRRIAQEVGLDPNAAVVKWPRMSEEEKKTMHPQLLQIQDTLVNSEGLDVGKTGKVRDLEAEQRKWGEAFGNEEAEMLRAFVKSSMPHYEYLKERRLRL